MNRVLNLLVPRRSLPSNVPVGGGDDVWIPACAGMTSLMMIADITTQSLGRNDKKELLKDL
jgi:hypothetical protein